MCMCVCAHTRVCVCMCVFLCGENAKNNKDNGISLLLFRGRKRGEKNALKLFHTPTLSLSRCYGWGSDVRHHLGHFPKPSPPALHPSLPHSSGSPTSSAGPARPAHRCPCQHTALSANPVSPLLQETMEVQNGSCDFNVILPSNPPLIRCEL